MPSISIDPLGKHSPYRVTTEEMKQSLEWLEDEYKQDNAFVGGQRSEVKEIRFKAHDVSMIKAIEDKEILRKFVEARSLDIHLPQAEKGSTH